MTVHKIGFLHPGQMGVSIAAAARQAGHTACWASDGRGAATRERAEQHGLLDLGTIAHMCAECVAIVSVCPPHAAEDVANAVAAHSFTGVYVDANAISPHRAAEIGATVRQAGASFVDGGIIGGPAWKAGTTWLHLSGPRADEVATWFSPSPLSVEVLGPEIGSASALKMCYAAYSKGATALLAAILATAESLHVRAALNRQWARDDAAFPESAERRVRASTAKAWRFAGEMDEIAATLAAAGLPDGFHRAAGEVNRRLASFKDASPAPDINAILLQLLQGSATDNAA